MPREIGPLTYEIRGPWSDLTFTSPVLRHFDRHRQRRRRDAEAGGQLFASYAEDAIVIEVATGPYWSDTRSRTRFTPDRKRELKDIAAQFHKGLHFIGNWHTHPERCPHPSSLDIGNTRQRFVESNHELEAFVVAIVGLDDFPAGLSVSLVNDRAERRLTLRESGVPPVVTRLHPTL